jgi:CheY-like chemotaxis protein
MQVLIERILVREGHRIVLAANGREGLRALKSGPFELVLTDLFMPDMDGIELVDREEGLEAENGNGSEVVDKHRVLPVKAVPRSEALQNTIGVAAGAAR